MYQILLIIHSILRYAFLFSALYAIYLAVSGWQGKLPYTAKDNKASVFLILFTHTQAVIGLLLYFVFSPYSATPMKEAMKDPVLRFWKVEHITIMLIAVAIIQTGRILSKKASTDLAKHKKAAIFYIIGLLLVLASIPWPFAQVARPWFRF
ncbi:MAG: cytochrome B [Opitutaceae bacterium]|nr:cytochrome B [Cytophagales bacterium]